MSGGGAIFWLILAAALFIIEGATVQLVCIWFAIGSLFAMLAAFVGAPVWLQLLICAVSSLAVLIVGRPLLLDRITPKKSATNADRVIGQPGIVLEEIDNIRQTGRVSANGLDWSARSETGEIFQKGETVLVTQIEGVKLIVRPFSYAEPQPAEQEPYGPQQEPYPEQPYPEQSWPEPQQEPPLE